MLWLHWNKASPSACLPGLYEFYCFTILSLVSDLIGERSLLQRICTGLLTDKFLSIPIFELAWL